MIRKEKNTEVIKTPDGNGENQCFKTKWLESYHFEHRHL